MDDVIIVAWEKNKKNLRIDNLRGIGGRLGGGLDDTDPSVFSDGISWKKLTNHVIN